MERKRINLYSLALEQGRDPEQDQYETADWRFRYSSRSSL